MDASAASAHLDRMLQVKHLVIDNVLNGKARNAGVVEYPADHDCIMRRIVMSQPVARTLVAPGHLWPRQQAMEEAGVQVLKNFIEVVGVPAGGCDLLPSAQLPDQISLARHVAAEYVAPVFYHLLSVQRLSVHLGKQNMSDGLQNIIRRALQQI